MARIDRNVLRLGVFELKYRDRHPAEGGAQRGRGAGQEFGTEESSAFINGLLDRIALGARQAVSMTAARASALEALDALTTGRRAVPVRRPRTSGRSGRGRLRRLAAVRRLSRVLLDGFFTGTRGESLLLPSDGRHRPTAMFDRGARARRRGPPPRDACGALCPGRGRCSTVQGRTASPGAPGVERFGRGGPGQAFQEAFVPAFRGAGLPCCPMASRGQPR